MTTRTTATPAAPDWRRHQLPCRDRDAELFFPLGDSDLFQQQIRTAKDACTLCPITYDCREYAIDTAQHGVWGATTEQERRAIARDRANARRRANRAAEAAA